jgi:conjugal transfer pilus assembly protein TrbC
LLCILDLRKNKGKRVGKSMTEIVFIKISFIIFLLGIASLARADSSYIDFAHAQAANIAAITSPYNVDINEIKNHVSDQQQFPAVKNFIREVTASQQQSLTTTVVQQPFESILIFVSFSMPQTSLKQWLDQAHRTGASVVIRGLINNSFKETLSAMTRLVTDNTGGLLLDPTLFQKFDIKQVPAVVILQPSACSNEQSCLPRFDVIYGDVTLEYALQKLREQGEFSANNLLKRKNNNGE